MPPSSALESHDLRIVTCKIHGGKQTSLSCTVSLFLPPAPILMSSKPTRMQIAQNMSRFVLPVAQLDWFLFRSKLIQLQERKIRLQNNIGVINPNIYLVSCSSCGRTLRPHCVDGLIYESLVRTLRLSGWWVGGVDGAHSLFMTWVGRV